MVNLSPDLYSILNMTYHLGAFVDPEFHVVTSTSQVSHNQFTVSLACEVRQGQTAEKVKKIESAKFYSWTVISVFYAASAWGSFCGLNWHICHGKVPYSDW